MDESGYIVELPPGGLPWKDHLFALEAEKAIPRNEVSFIIFQKSSGEWRTQTIAISADGSKPR